MKKQFILVFSCCCLALSMGCQTPGKHGLNADGLPSAKYLVGGGPSIDWTAPADGVAYFADATSRKMIQTKSLDEGKRFEVEMELTDEDVLRTLKNLGIDPQKAKFQLYFIPAQTEEPELKPKK